MTHEVFRDRLITLAGATAGDPAGFLDGLSPIHDAWHREGSRTYGFLLFHTRVVRHFNQIVAPVVQPQIESFTEAEFEGMGVRLFQYDVETVEPLPSSPIFRRPSRAGTILRTWGLRWRPEPQ